MKKSEYNDDDYFSSLLHAITDGSNKISESERMRRYVDKFMRIQAEDGKWTVVFSRVFALEALLYSLCTSALKNDVIKWEELMILYQRQIDIESGGSQ